MIVMNVFYRCRQDQWKRFLGAIRDERLGEASRKEEGNIRYDFYVPADGRGDLLLVEKWRDADALAKHMEEPHFKRLGQIKEKLGIETVIEKYIADE